VAFEKAGGSVYFEQNGARGLWPDWRLVGLARQHDGVDVGLDTASSDGQAGEKLVQLFVVSGDKLQKCTFYKVKVLLLFFQFFAVKCVPGLHD
jgi:hypothetical protein